MPFLPGCSMVPNDEDIINWSVLENEIFWDGLLDDGLDDWELLESDKKLLVDDEWWNENLQNEDYVSSDNEEDLDWKVVVDVQ